ncbi:MAG: hypothetical protein H6Q13_3470 [Bacteroidetes bacterium]|nr:hypothetical protein [Bacteroidota bacterium]
MEWEDIIMNLEYTEMDSQDSISAYKYSNEPNVFPCDK